MRWPRFAAARFLIGSALVLQRGVRADEAAPGSASASPSFEDLAELYGGSFWLDQSPGGGLRARLQLPSC